MTSNGLKRILGQRRVVYLSLADECASVPELMLRLEVMGSKWSRWDWALFFHCLAYSGNEKSACGGYLIPAAEREIDGPCSNPERFAADLLKSFDETDELDRVLTDKAVVLSFIGLAETWRWDRWSLRVLAHVFDKFPRLWSVSWMWVRHGNPAKAGRTRSHVLAWSLDGLERPQKYWESDASRADFVHRYAEGRA